MHDRWIWNLISSVFGIICAHCFYFNPYAPSLSKNPCDMMQFNRKLNFYSNILIILHCYCTIGVIERMHKYCSFLTLNQDYSSYLWLSGWWPIRKRTISQTKRQLFENSLFQKVWIDWLGAPSSPHPSSAVLFSAPASCSVCLILVTFNDFYIEF